MPKKKTKKKFRISKLTISIFLLVVLGLGILISVFYQKLENSSRVKQAIAYEIPFEWAERETKSNNGGEKTILTSPNYNYYPNINYPNNSGVEITLIYTPQKRNIDKILNPPPGSYNLALKGVRELKIGGVRTSTYTATDPYVTLQIYETENGLTIEVRLYKFSEPYKDDIEKFIESIRFKNNWEW